MDESTVVSEMGEQWSPQIAPARTALTAPRRKPYWEPSAKPVPPAKDTVSGTTSGIMIAIVVHEVPVAKAMAPDVTNTRAGSTHRGRLPLNSPDR